MGGASIWHWIVVGLIVMLLFGRGKISEMMGDVAKGIKAFKKGMTEDEATTTGTTPATGTTPVSTTPATTETVRTIEHQSHQPAATTAAPAGAATAGAGDRKIG